MLSSLATRRSLMQRYLTRSSTVGQTRNNITAAATVLASNHVVMTSLSLTKVLPSILNRSFSSNGGSYGGGPPNGPLRSQPQYAIFGEKTMLSMKMIPPVFRCLKNGSLVLEQNKKGRILLEWSPRGDAGTLLNDLAGMTLNSSLIAVFSLIVSIIQYRWF